MKNYPEEINVQYEIKNDGLDLIKIGLENKKYFELFKVGATNVLVGNMIYVKGESFAYKKNGKNLLDLVYHKSNKII